MRTVLSLLGILCCFWLAWINARVGLARIHYLSGDQEYLLSDAATKLSPNDPDAHYRRANALLEINQTAEAVKEYEQAVALRPRDFYLWLELGYALVQSGDDAGAHTAYTTAVKLAPHYAQPHQRLGEFLLRTGSREEAFVEFRRAATSDPAQLQELIDLAWKEYGEDGSAVQRVVAPQSPLETLALARSFLEHERTAEAMNLFRAAGVTETPERRQLLAELLREKKFVEAYEVWSGSLALRNSGFMASVTDGGFESELNKDNLGFGWHATERSKKIAVSRDPDMPDSGEFSLRVSFGGDSNPSEDVAKQLLIVKPETSYRVHFAARTQKLVTGGLPFLSVVDASDQLLLGRSTPLPADTQGWEKHTIQFRTGSFTQAVNISLRRDKCSSSPCPVFGSLWLDSFSLEVAE